MGCRCSAPRKVKTTQEERDKPEKRKNETSTTVKSGEMSPLLQRSSCQDGLVATQETRGEETFSEKQACGHTMVRVNSASPCYSETQDLDPVSTEEKEANWVDDNRADLIQDVELVMQIADKMYQKGVLHKEMYANIYAAQTPMEKMRVLYGALSTTQAKSIFYRILQDIKPATCETEDVIREVMKEHKKYLRKRLNCESEGAQKDNAIKNPLDKIYTELHIIQGESERVNTEHEIWGIEDKARIHTTESTKINCNDIFKSSPDSSVSSGQNEGEVRAFRTVMTKGIAGIGKTVSVKKFILDWADGIANQDLDFIFVLPFRELNLVIEKKFTLATLVEEFHPELKKIAIVRVFAHYKVLFIFDGLDESQLKLDFKKTTRLTSNTEESPVDTLVTNLIREHLLPSAFIWITSRPRAVHRIPRQYIYQWTEVRGFNDSQKIEYFRKRIDDTAHAEKIVNLITRSRSLYIMCHIPIFCWIAATVFEHLVPKEGNIHDENAKIPATLTEMYTHFLTIQTRVATEKYGTLDESDTEEIFKSNEEFLFKLSRMAFEYLHDGQITFTLKDLEKYGIDIDKAGVHCGLCTEVFKEEGMFNRKKLYCFVHLTVQEYFAALFVYRSFASKKIDSQILKDFLLKDSEENLKSILDKDPVDLPLDELIEITIANSAQTESGELDMFLRFLIGMSLQSTQELLQGLIQQTEEHSAVIEDVKKSLLEIDLADCSAERCLNLVHCLMELKDHSLYDTVCHCFIPDPRPERQLSPVQCSALADSILMSKTPLDEFSLKKYRPSPKGIFRLVPAVRNCRKARISGVDLGRWILETIASALKMPNSVLTELHLMNSIWNQHTKMFTEALTNTEAKLEALSLSGRTNLPDCENLAAAIKSVISNLRELELSGNILYDSLRSVVSAGLCEPKLKKLRLNRNYGIANICKELASGFKSGPCYLKELELSYCCFEDSEMDILSAGLMSKHCTLEVLSLSHNRLSEKGCQTLASTLKSNSSHLREVDLSYNDLHNSGVLALSNALRNPHCGLKTLRLSFCKVTGDGCASLASALRSDHCSLRELDLSFNHLTDQGVKLLTEIQRDSRYSLEELNVDQNEEYWFDWKLLRQYACDLTLDVNTVSENVILTEDNKKASYVKEKQPYPDHPERFHENVVLCEEALTSRHYWEVESISTDVGVAYKSIDRVSDCSSETVLGKNEKSWCWFSAGSFNHNYSCLEFPHSRQPLLDSTTGVFLDWPAGILSFFRVFPDRVTHLYTARTTFTEPLYAGFNLDASHPSSAYLCKIE